MDKIILFLLSILFASIAIIICVKDKRKKQRQFTLFDIAFLCAMSLCIIFDVVSIVLHLKGII